MTNFDEPRSFYDIRERFSSIPNRYEEIPRISSVRRLLEQMSFQWRVNRTSIKYLDIGCGDCNGTTRFSKFISEVTKMTVETVGIDKSLQCAIPCNEQKIQFLKLDLNNEPIPFSNHFQIITIFETIEHIFETDYLLQCVHNTVSKDGIIFITTLNVVCWKNRILVPLGIQPINTEVSTKRLSHGYRLNFIKKRVDFWKPSGHIRPFTLYSLQDLLFDNNFIVIDSFGLENWRLFKFFERISKNMCTGILVVARPHK